MLLFSLYFWLNKFSSAEHTRFFLGNLKTWKILPTLNFWTVMYICDIFASLKEKSFIVRTKIHFYCTFIKSSFLFNKCVVHTMFCLSCKQYVLCLINSNISKNEGFVHFSLNLWSAAHRDVSFAAITVQCFNRWKSMPHRDHLCHLSNFTFYPSSCSNSFFLCIWHNRLVCAVSLFHSAFLFFHPFCRKSH